MYRKASNQSKYCYPGTEILINKPDIRDQHKLTAYESIVTTRRNALLVTQPMSGSFDFAHVFEQWKLKMWNIMDSVQKESVFTLGHWIIFHDRWLANLTSPKIVKPYKYGDIVMSDLGATNFGSEPQFEHPCIVLINDFASVLVVPCTSVKPLKPKFPDEIEATTGDGFKNPTRIQLRKFRWIDKKRITDRVGAVVNPLVMKDIEDYIINQFPYYNSIVKDHVHEVALLENELLKKKKKSMI